MGHLPAEDALVTVIVPCYNTASYLDACLQSVCAQTHGKLEVILIDDGSEDDSGAICDKWASRDDRIVVVHQEHQGPSARNTGIEMACGDYLAFVDSDDTVAERYVENMLKAAVDSCSSIVVCGYERVSEAGEVLSVRHLGVEGPVSARKFCEYVLSDVLYPSVWGKLYARSALREARLGQERIAEDVTLWASLVASKSMDKCYAVDEPLYRYTQRGGSLMRSFDLGADKAMVGAWDRFCDEVERAYGQCGGAVSMRRVRSRVEMADRAVAAGSASQLTAFDEYRLVMRKHMVSYLRRREIGLKRKAMTVLMMVSLALYGEILQRLRGR